jgi:threonine/homoserine/homoserine lactone efflux protein
MTVTLIMTLFVAVPTTYYLFFSVIEIACTAVIVWYAWHWSYSEGNSINIALAQAEPDYIRNGY